MLNRQAEPSDLTCILEADPGKLEIKRRELAFYLSVNKLVHSPKSDFDVVIDFCAD